MYLEWKRSQYAAREQMWIDLRKLDIKVYHSGTKEQQAVWDDITDIPFFAWYYIPLPERAESLDAPVQSEHPH